MKPSFITDEASQSLDEAIPLARQFGVDAIELRSVDGSAVYSSGAESVKKISAKLIDAGINVCCLDTPVFKCKWDSDLDVELRKLEVALNSATMLGTSRIRLFSFWREDDIDTTNAVTLALNGAHGLCHGSGVKLLVENGKRTSHRTGLELSALMETLCGDCFGVVWDPGNSLLGGADEDPVANGYSALRGAVDHVHVKDPKIGRDGKREYVQLGTGDLRLREQIDELHADGYQGYLSLETHWRPNAVLTSTLMDTPYGYDFSANGLEATRQSLKILCGWISDSKNG